ncbi:PilZ domain-containing protein [Devosia sp. RR2S18]|uniref:PilZ domain-containing protein n=1 Tax=Devosia rhizosphaerae TaxID=3049774 RepID=UPI0032EEE304
MSSTIQYARFIGGVASRLTLLDKSDRPVSNSAVSCWTSSLSPIQVVVSCGKQLGRGQKLVVQLAAIGGFLGRVERAVDGGFAIRLLLDEAGRRKLSAKIVWYRKRVLHAAADNRSYKRWRPARRESTLLLADARTASCRVLDVSASGAAVAVELRPGVGEPLAVGQLVGKVVRHLDEGFAVQFLSIQDEGANEELLLPLAPDANSAFYFYID